MAIAVVCPHCEHDFEIPDEFAGVKGKCPQCGDAFTAPGEQTTKSQPGPPPVAGENEPPTPVEAEVESPPVQSVAIAKPPASTIPKPPSHQSRPVGVAAPFLAACMFALFLLLAGGATAAWWVSQHSAATARNDDTSELTDELPPLDATNPQPVTPAKPKPIDAKTRSRIIAVHGPSVAKITATTTTGRSVFSQAGWVIDHNRRLVATAYLPVDRVASVQVTFQNVEEDTVEAAGVVAQSSLHDYTILQLRAASLPPQINITETIRCKEHTPLTIGAIDHNVWPLVWSLGPLNDTTSAMFAHTGRMAAFPPGSPIFNSIGDVVGFNTLVDPEPNGQGRAMSAMIIREVLASLSAEPAVTKFAGGALAVSDPKEKTDEPEVSTTPDEPAAKVELKVDDLIAAIGEARTAVEVFNWLPKTAEQQASWNKLARLITACKQIEDDQTRPDTDRITAGSAAQQVLVDLSREPWPDDKNLAIINYLAMGDREENDFGFHGFGVCLQWMETEIEDRPVALMQLLGTELFIAVPVNVAKEEMPRGSVWRVMGEIRPDKTVPISAPDGAGGFKNTDVKVIESKYIIGRPE